MAAACAVALGCGAASAQIVPPDYPDPLAPKLQTDPRKAPPRFQQFSRPEQAQLGPSLTFSSSAAGDTGFDSSNKNKAKAKAAARAKPKPKVGAAASMSPA